MDVSDSFALFVVRAMAEHKANNASLPSALQHHVLDAFTISTVIPL